MNTDLSLLHLIQEASFVVQFVMVLLLIASLASWTFIFSKRKELNRAIEITDEFEEQFWSGMALTELYRKLAAKDFKPEGIEKYFWRVIKNFPECVKAVRLSLRCKLKVRNEPCGLNYHANWIDWMSIYRFWQQSVQLALMLAYSAQCGGL